MVFVGGSLVKHGGQNFLEPAFLGKPVIVGPHLFNFRDIASQFLDQRAMVMVHSADEMSRAVSTLLTDKTQEDGPCAAGPGIDSPERGSDRAECVLYKRIHANRENVIQ